MTSSLDPTRGGVPRQTVVFRVAAGPRMGFGHALRADRLARVLGEDARISLRGSPGVARTLSRYGFRITQGRARSTLTRHRPALLVLDDPSATACDPWLGAARELDVPVASLHDAGMAHVASDLRIDPGLVGWRGRRLAGECLEGPRFAVLDPRLADLRTRRRPAAGRVLIGLGGGQHALRGLAIARAVKRLAPDVHVQVAPGFAGGRTMGAPRDVEIVDPAALLEALAAATVAVVNGGVTLYEACAIGTPVVALPMVAGQAVTVTSFCTAGVLPVDPVLLDPAGPWPARQARVVERVRRLLLSREARARQSRSGRALIDGQGARRVASALRILMRAAPSAKAA